MKTEIELIIANDYGIELLTLTALNIPTSKNIIKNLGPLLNGKFTLPFFLYILCLTANEFMVLANYMVIQFIKVICKKMVT